MFGIKWNNKLKPSKVAKPLNMNQELAKFGPPAPKGYRQPPKPWDVKGWKSPSEKAAEEKQKLLDEETV